MDNEKLTPWPDIDENILHIYAQYEWHMEAFILGTESAITALRDACDRALQKGHAETPCEDSCMFTNDGEGYQVCIGIIKDKETLQNIAGSSPAPRTNMPRWLNRIRHQLSKLDYAGSSPARGL